MEGVHGEHDVGLRERRGDGLCHPTQSLRILRRHRHECDAVRLHRPGGDRRQRPSGRPRLHVERLELHVAHAQRVQRHGHLPRRRRRRISVHPGPENPREHGLHHGTGRALHHLRRGRKRRRNPALYPVWSGPAAKLGYTSSVSYNHFSHLSTVEANWNLPPLNANDSAARNMSEFFVGSPPDFSLSASPWSLSFIAGGSAMSNVSLQPQHGFQGAVTLDATSNPAGVTAVCSPSVISGGETSACSMTSSAAGSFDVSISGTAGATVNRSEEHTSE